MSILKKAYDSIKQTIEFEFFKRKFNNWLETREIDILDEINKYDIKMMECLSREQFGAAFNCFRTIKDRKTELKELLDYKNYILKKVKDGN